MRHLTSLRALLAGAVVATGLLGIPAAAPSPVLGLGPLPDCRLDDILTVPRGYADYPVTLVDWILSVGKSYVPPDLVNVRTTGLAGSGLVRKVASTDLKAMATAARAAGAPIGSWSAYRSYATQVALFNGYAKGYGTAAAVRFSARPGHSEHQLGLAIDFMSAGGGSPMGGDWATTKAGAWMSKHAWEYGWVLSYPKGKTDVTCYNYEPWHYRYLGREVAAKVHASGMTIREYLWANDTAVNPTTGQPLPTATVEPSPAGSTAPSAEALGAASPGASAMASALPEATFPPSSTAGSIFGLDPTVVIASLALVVAAVALIASVGFVRRQRR
jgi:zinc D-Ala-D-Ala carboxypeptidase